MFVVTELNKQTGQERVMKSFTDRDDALMFWRQIAFENIDHAHLWHRMRQQAAH